MIKDNINNPEHYLMGGGIEPIDFIESNNLNYIQGNIIKYVFRHGSKNGLEDLKKAEFYLKRLIKSYENNKPNLPNITKEN